MKAKLKDIKNPQPLNELVRFVISSFNEVLSKNLFQCLIEQHS